jgi:hypothetical protein
MGILSLAGYSTIRDCNIAGFTGQAGYATDQLDATLYLGEGAQGNFTFFEFCDVTHCGAGIKFRGGNSNGCMAFQINVDYIGLWRTNVDAVDYLNTAPTWGTGASCAWDAGSGNSKFSHIYGQAFGGCPWRNDRPDQAGSSSMWETCVAEITELAHFVGRPLVLQCTNIPDTGQGIITGLGNSRGIQENDKSGSVQPWATLSNNGGGLYSFQSAEDLPFQWAMAYGNTGVAPTGYWALKYGSGQPSAYLLSSLTATKNPGIAWLAFERGYLQGETAALIYRGPLASTGRPTGRFQDRGLRGGVRKVGDRFML